MDQQRRLGYEFEHQMLEALAAALRAALGDNASVSSARRLPLAPDSGAVPDGLIEIEMQGKSLDVYVEVKKTLYPRDIRNAVWNLNACMRHRNHRHEAVGMVAADTLSPGAKRELVSQNVAFFDLGGSLYLKHDHWLLNIEKAPRRNHKIHHGLELFTDARESVVHTLLKHSNEWLNGTELSMLAETSQYTCSLVLQELTLREWVESVGSGPSKRRMLSQPGKLLDAWAEQWQERKDKQTKWYTFVENPKDLLAHLAEQINRDRLDFPWAFTGASAANAVSPLLTSTGGAEIILPKGYAERMAKVLGLKPVSKGANVTLIERHAASLLHRHRQPDPPAFFASAYILYLDLLDGRGRNAELADHLRNRLESSWERN